MSKEKEPDFGESTINRIREPAIKHIDREGRLSGRIYVPASWIGKEVVAEVKYGKLTK